MIGKVTVSKEIAKAIEFYLHHNNGDKAQLLNAHAKSGAKWITVATEAMNGLDQSDMARALLIGYNVEPDYKVGDWIVYTNGKLFVAGEIAMQVTGITAYGMNVAFDRAAHYSQVRHATPEEIKAEKERQLWAKLGRKVGEFKEGDIGIFANGSATWTLAHVERNYRTGNLVGFYPRESYISFEDGENEE